MELRDEEALSFYLRAVVTFHRLRQAEAAKEAGGEEETSKDDGAEDELKK